MFHTSKPQGQSITEKTPLWAISHLLSRNRDSLPHWLVRATPDFIIPQKSGIKSPGHEHCQQGMLVPDRG